MKGWQVGNNNKYLRLNSPMYEYVYVRESGWLDVATAAGSGSAVPLAAICTLYVRTVHAFTSV